MRLTRVTAPTEEAIDAAFVKTLLNIEPDFSETLVDARIDALIGAVTDYLDGPTGILGRAILQQTWLLELERWPDRLPLPVEPVSAVTVSWFDGVDSEATLPATDYEIVSTPASRPELVWTASAALPQLGPRMFPVRVEITAGAVNATAVPKSLREVMGLLAAHWYEHRAAVSGPAAVEMPFGISAMLARHRVML